MFNRPKASRPPERPKQRKARPKKPSLPLSDALAALNAEFRPDHVDPRALLFVAWTDLPGANQIENQDFHIAQAWKNPIQKHFAECLKEQLHPGILENPRVHILLLVRTPGDEKNRGRRAKYVIDRLEPYREHQRRRTPTKTNPSEWTVVKRGLLGLIQDDKVLTDATCVIEERRVRVTPDENPCKVLMWVWDEPPAPF